jgi:endonuclease YncB( thermonuclease family)
MGNGTKLAVLATAIVLASSCSSGTAPATGPVKAAGTGSSPLLMPADGGDGDSWHDTAGAEYRLGLVNTPEYNECYGSEATAKRKELTAHGFRADVYTHDVYGRGVSIVTTANGVNVNVYLARYGFANDKYLSQFRHENPKLASQLDTAFAKARAERLGLWSACSGTHGAAAPLAPAPVAPAPVAPATTYEVTACHPDYVTCIPVRGDGSGHGRANDLNCGSIRKPVRLRHIEVDPYQLDADGDGIGCQS